MLSSKLFSPVHLCHWVACCSMPLGKAQLKRISAIMSNRWAWTAFFWLQTILPWNPLSLIQDRKNFPLVLLIFFSQTTRTSKHTQTHRNCKEGSIGLIFIHFLETQQTLNTIVTRLRLTLTFTLKSWFSILEDMLNSEFIKKTDITFMAIPVVLISDLVCFYYLSSVCSLYKLC